VGKKRKKVSETIVRNVPKKKKKTFWAPPPPPPPTNLGLYCVIHKL